MEENTSALIPDEPKLMWGDGLYIVCTPRSGSTNLQYLLNTAMGLEEGGSIYGIAEHLSYMSEGDFVKNEVPASKIHAHWIGSRVRFRLPETATVVLLQRLDRVAQAKSLIIANALMGQFPCNTGDPIVAEQRRAAAANVPLEEWEIQDKLRHIDCWEVKMQNWTRGCRAIRTSYEQIVSQPFDEVARILSMARLTQVNHPTSSLLKL